MKTLKKQSFILIILLAFIFSYAMAFSYLVLEAGHSHLTYQGNNFLVVQEQTFPNAPSPVSAEDCPICKQIQNIIAFIKQIQKYVPIIFLAIIVATLIIFIENVIKHSKRRIPTLVDLKVILNN
jgi:hypothetical protein